MADDMTIDDFLESLPRRGRRGRAPAGWTSREGDCAYFYRARDPNYRERVDNVLTVYRSLKDDKIVGVQIKGLTSLPEHDAMGVAVDDRREVEVVVLLLLTYRRATGLPDPAAELRRTRVYKETIRRFQDEKFNLRDMVEV
jgi:hypothetical protein